MPERSRSKRPALVLPALSPDAIGKWAELTANRYTPKDKGPHLCGPLQMSMSMNGCGLLGCLVEVACRMRGAYNTCRPAQSCLLGDLAPGHHVKESALATKTLGTHRALFTGTEHETKATPRRDDCVAVGSVLDADECHRITLYRAGDQKPVMTFDRHQCMYAW